MNIEESFFDSNYAAAGIFSVSFGGAIYVKHDNIYSTSDQYINSDVVYQCLFTFEVY